VYVNEQNHSEEVQLTAAVRLYLYLQTVDDIVIFHEHKGQFKGENINPNNTTSEMSLFQT